MLTSGWLTNITVNFVVGGGVTFPMLLLVAKGQNVITKPVLLLVVLSLQLPPSVAVSCVPG